jgi:O-methyltransferase
MQIDPLLLQQVKLYTLCTPDRLNNLAALCEYLNSNQIKGDFVECGTYKGGSAAIISTLLNDRHLWLYDSFEGMPPTSEKDGDEAKNWVGECAGAIEDLKTILHTVGTDEKSYTIRAGWFETTFKEELPQQIALLHCDADWYDSVTSVLETFYPLVVEGGCVVLDDFGYWEGCREAFYDFCYRHNEKPVLERIGPDQAFWIKGRSNNRQSIAQITAHQTQGTKLSMMAPSEQDYLYNFAKHQFVGEGAIVDLGCWLGSSTVALAKGLQENKPGTKIHSFDLFRWDSSMNLFTQGSDLQFAQGESFLSEYLKQIEPWKDQVQVYEGDLREFPWTGGAIEFLFIDAMKSWDLANAIIQKYFGSLIPGRSIVYHQDFSYFGSYWIHLTMDRLREYFEPLYDVPHAWGFVFRLKKAIPEEVLARELSISDCSVEDIDRAFDTACEWVSTEKKSQIVGAKIMALMAIHQTERVRFELEKAVSNGLSVADLELTLGLSFPTHVIQHCSAEIAELKARIAAMESSKFWKLRSAWFKVKRQDS